MLELLRRILTPRDPPPVLTPLVEEAAYQRQRAEGVVERLDREHERDLVRRERADAANALLRARDWKRS